VIEEFDRGLILAPCFYEALQGFEKGEEGLEDFIPELIKAIDWDDEKARAASIDEMRRASALHSERISREKEEQAKRFQQIQTLLSSANDLLIKLEFDEAGKLLEETIQLDANNPSALFGLAQVAGRRQALDLALNLYARAAANAGGKTWIAGWSYMRSGNIFRLRGDLVQARREWSKVLQLGGDLHGAEQEAEKALYQTKPRQDSGAAF